MVLEPKKRCVLFFCLTLSGWSFAQVSLTAELTSDYIWRGYTQNNNDPSFSFDVAYATSYGLYADLWAANVTKEWGIEIDGTVGYAKELASGLNLDMGYIYYKYTKDCNGECDPEFGEVFFGVGYGWFSTQYSYDPENENGYLEGAVEWPIAENWAASLKIGDYQYDEGEASTDILAKLGYTWRSLEFSVSYADLNGRKGIPDEDAFYASIAWSWGPE